MNKKLTGVPGVPRDAAVGIDPKTTNNGKVKVNIMEETETEKIAMLKFEIKELREDFHHLRERFESWHEMRGADLDVYKTIKKKVYEDAEMVFMIRMFLREEMGFDPRKQYLKDTGRKEHHVKQD
tara:strand:+ start:673 stop:1047 length:375 start_codon:yes stop_codon:yes gene_type:complete